MSFGSASVYALLSRAGAGSTDVWRAAAGRARDGARRESKAPVGNLPDDPRLRPGEP
jgi:hypothetical protein